jgi:hypothetical protein
MPLLKAFPLGLLLNATTTVTFGDGSTATKLTALEKVTIEGVWTIGVVLLEEGSTDVLIGMDFLKRFGVSLMVHPSTPTIIALVEEAAVTKAFEEAAKSKGLLTPSATMTGTAAEPAPASTEITPPLSSE